MSTTGASHIYLGPWVNWDHGLILGSTITLSARDGAFFTSFLATFITIVGAQLWRILCYIFHQARSSRGPQDGLHHQHQVIFRNTSSPGGAAWSFMRMSTAWRNRTRHPILRSLPWALLAILYMLIFGVLSVFQSQTVKSTGNDRLVTSDNCGYWEPDIPATKQTALAYAQKTTNDTILAADYARACYGGSPNHLQCSLYPVVAIPWTEDRNATCPFQDGICIADAFKMDTGLVDSHKMLGINAPVHERVQYRKVTTCAPIHTKNFTTVIEGEGADVNGYLKGDIIYELNYGQYVEDGVVSLNYTFIYNIHAVIDFIGYSLDTAIYGAQSPSNTWFPVPAIKRTDADISLVSVSANSMRYDEACDDPIFSAHTMYSYLTPSGQNISWYVPDYYVTVIGCAEQHQICNPNNNVCTPLGGQQNLLNESNEPALDLNLIQQGAAQRVFFTTPFTSIQEAVYTRKNAALRAQETVTDLDQAPLPKDQWTIEVSNWYNEGLARIQRTIVEFATGPTNVVDGLRTYIPDDLVSRAMCYSQKIADPQGTLSFSVLGVAIILSVGGFIIATSLGLDALVGWLQMRLKKGEHARLNWVLDDKLQLQRMAYEGAGMGHWDGHTEAVPTTERGEVFGGWADLDAEKPTLVKSVSEETLVRAERSPFAGKTDEFELQRTSLIVRDLRHGEQD